MSKKKGKGVNIVGNTQSVGPTVGRSLLCRDQV